MVLVVAIAELMEVVDRGASSDPNTLTPEDTATAGGVNA